MRNREIRASQNKNRVWVSLLADVCDLAKKIPPILIFQQKSQDLKDS